MKNFTLTTFNKRLLLGAAILLCFWITFSTYRRWQPEQQILLHQAAFFTCFEEGDWKKLDHLLAEDFTTVRGQGKELILKEGREYRRHFFYLVITPAEEQVEFPSPDRDEATYTSSLSMTGKGTAIAQVIIGKVNATGRTPFIFHWKKQSWKPWDWALTSIEHPLLHSRY